MKKIGILTFHKSKNYGSALQAYALQNYMNKYSDKVELIDYIPLNQSDLYAIFRKIKNLKMIINNVLSAVDYLYLKKRTNKFQTFWKEYRLSPPVNSANDLEDLRYDVICAGGDQIWNVTLDDFDYIYTIPVKCEKKISYAVSMGKTKDSLNKKINQKFYDNLNEFSYISVREENAADILKKGGIYDPKIVLDPVFLLERDIWDELSGQNCIIKGKYIVLYSIEYYDDIIDIANTIKRMSSLPVYVIYTCKKTYKAMLKGFRRTKPCSPFEFMNIIKFATLVVSSSFHGCVFSIIFNKNFWAIEEFVNGKVIYENRIRTLLKSFSLETRIINCTTDFNNKIYTDIDYEKVNKAVTKKVIESKKYIEEAVNGYE